MARKRLLAITLMLLFANLNCKDKVMRQLQTKKDLLNAISEVKWTNLSKKKMFFGHQSVGQNIIQGLKDIIAVSPHLDLLIRETSDPGDFYVPLFAHSRIGENGDPTSKIDDFYEKIDGGLGSAADIAFFKLCYLDINHETDLDSVFRHYSETVADLGKRFPDLKIITFTVPLRTRPKGIKSEIKSLLGRFPWLEEDNIKRNKYNRMLRQKFGESVFDLAKMEATSPEGSVAEFSSGGETYLRLNRNFTQDGGHLNEAGRQSVAIDLLLFLVSLSKE